MTDKIQSSKALRGHNVVPRRELVLRLGQQGEERPYYKGCRIIEEKLNRLDELHAEYRDRCREVLEAERRVAKCLRVAEGRERTAWQRENDTVTEQMERARSRLPDLRERMNEARSTVEQMEQESQQIAEWLFKNSLYAAERRTGPNTLPDADQTIREMGSRPRPSALTRQDVAHGWD